MDTWQSKTFQIATFKLPDTVFRPNGQCPLQKERTFQIAEKFNENQEQVTQTSLNSFFFLSMFFVILNKDPIQN